MSDIEYDVVYLSDGHDISHGELGLLAAVDELTGVDTLGGDEQLLTGLVPVCCNFTYF